MVLTLHYRPEDGLERAQQLQDYFEGFAVDVADAGIGVRVHLGAELGFRFGLAQLAQSVTVARLAGGPYVLVDLPPGPLSPGLEQAFFEIRTAGYRPVLAHSERHRELAAADRIEQLRAQDLLLEIDRMEFYVYETKETVRAVHRPIILITSNNEKELPDAFLRRCFFHYIRFPERETMERIVDVHFPDIKKRLVATALGLFYDIREAPGLKKKPSTSELLDWLKLLMAEDISPEVLRATESTQLIPPLYGALLKSEQDVQLFERLAFLNRREQR